MSPSSHFNDFTCPNLSIGQATRQLCFFLLHSGIIGSTWYTRTHVVNVVVQHALPSDLVGKARRTCTVDHTAASSRGKHHEGSLERLTLQRHLLLVLLADQTSPSAPTFADGGFSRGSRIPKHPSIPASHPFLPFVPVAKVRSNLGDFTNSRKNTHQEKGPEARRRGDGGTFFRASRGG